MKSGFHEHLHVLLVKSQERESRSQVVFYDLFYKTLVYIEHL